jgi:hypothetical protein
MKTPNKSTTAAVCLLTAIGLTILAPSRRNSPSLNNGAPGAAAAKNSTCGHCAKLPLSEVIRDGEVETGGEESSGIVEQENEMPATGEEIFDAFNRWTRDYIARKGEENAHVSLRAGESLAIQRRNVLAEMIEADPQRALEMVVSAATRHELPSSIARHLEERVGGNGRLEVFASVHGSGEAPPHSGIDRVVTLKQHRFKAFVYGRRVNQSSMQSIPLHGIAIGDAMAVHESPVRVLEALELAELPAPAEGGHCPVSKNAGSPSAAVQVGDKVFHLCDAGHIVALAASYIAAEEASAGARVPQMEAAAVSSWAQGEKSVLLMRVNFPDDSEEPISESAADTLMQQVNKFYAMNSYGALNFTITISPVLTLQKPKSWYMGQDELLVTLPTMLEDARAAAAAAGLPMPDFDLVFVKRGVLSNSRAYVGDRGAWLQSSHPTIVAHELGHNLGLQHANAWKTVDGSTIGAGSALEYGNPFDTMGSGYGAFNMYYKSRLNWLPPSAIETITTSGVYKLYPSDVSSLEEGAIYALKLRKDLGREYWMETTQPLAGSLLVNWSDHPGTISGSQLLDMTPSTGSLYDAPLRPSEVFYDAGLGVKISPLGPSAADPKAHEVLVNFVHYIAIEAESGVAGLLSHDETASQGAYIELPEKNRGEAQFAIDIPEAGEYVIWMRTRGGSGSGVSITVAVDNEAETDTLLEPATAGEWHWNRLSVRIGGSEGSDTLHFDLSPGQHTIRVAASETGILIDCLLVTNDPSGKLPPTISPIANQVSVAAAPIRVLVSVLQIGASDPDVQITARSLNERLVSDYRIVVTGSGLNRMLEIAPAANQFGTGAILVTAVTSDHISVTTSFAISLIGPVQGLVNAAVPGETIVLPEGTYIDQVIIDKNLTLEGTGTRETSIEGNRAFATLTVASNATVEIRNVVLRKGRAIRNYGRLTLVECSVQGNQGSERGGGIWNGRSGKLVLKNSTISDNHLYGDGGGVYNDGELIVLNSTISGNRASSQGESHGGGIYNTGMLRVHNSTITANSAGAGGGIANAGNASARSSIIARNTSASGLAADLEGEWISEGHNLVQNTDGWTMRGDVTGNMIGQDPLIGALQDNGGPTLTHALMPQSPAIHAGSANGLAMDQRGYPRHRDLAAYGNRSDGSDIGAFETGAELEREAARLSVRFEPNGEVTVLLSGPDGSYWMVQATSDLVNSETLGIVALENGSGQITDRGARGATQRFYKATAY